MKSIVKLYLLVLFLLGINFGGFSQQIPLIDHYYLNTFLSNPAQAGFNGNQIYLLNRSQWVDVKGAPQTILGTLEGSFVNNTMGLGLMAYNDQVNIIGRTGVFGTYAYNLSLNKDAIISFGLSMGAEQNSLAFNEIDAEVPLEVTLINNSEKQVKFNANAGIALNYKGLYIGFSALQLLGSPLEFENEVEQDFKYAYFKHYLASAAYQFRFSESKFGFKPFAQMRMAQENGQQFDFGGVFDLKEALWLGAGFRTDYGPNFLAGVRLFNQISLSYSYGLSTADVKKLSRGSHEAMLGITLGSKERAKDSDKDGVDDKFDLEPDTPEGCEVDKLGISLDGDKDGVPNCRDKQLDSPFGAPVDEDGVALDGDKDGVIDMYDLEPETPEGCQVNKQGIALDDDKDGVPNCKDLELNTPFGVPVDSDGVGLDDDNDGVYNGFDLEPNTPEGCTTDSYGVALDGDKDGVPNCRDQQLNTPYGKVVDQYGVADGNINPNSSGLNDAVQPKTTSPTQNRIDLEEMIDNSTEWDYFVVIGVFKYADNVKRYQKHLINQYNEPTKILLTDAGYHYVWTKQVFTKKEARQEVDRLINKQLEDYIVGNPWLWKEPKK